MTTRTGPIDHPTPPTLRHALRCDQPPLRPSVMLGAGPRIRWRCPSCGAVAVLIGGVP